MSVRHGHPSSQNSTAHHASTRTVSFDARGERLKITIPNRIHIDGPPPSVYRQRASNRANANRGARDSSHFNSNERYSGPKDVQKPPNQNRAPRKLFHPRGAHHVQPRRHLPPMRSQLYNTPRGPVADLRELLNYQVPDTHYRMRARRCPDRKMFTNRSQNRTPSPSQMNGATFTRHGRCRPPRGGSASRPINVPSRGRARLYWHHDDRRLQHRPPDWTSKRMLDTRPGDEYIDDFNLEDFKLEIHMDAQSSTNRIRRSRRGRPARSSRGNPARSNQRQPAQRSSVWEADDDWDALGTSPSLDTSKDTPDEPYLKPAFQIWKEAGLDSSMKQRRSSETIRRTIERPSLSAQFLNHTWPSLYTTTDLLIDSSPDDTDDDSDILLLRSWCSQILVHPSVPSGLRRAYYSADDIRHLDGSKK